MQLMRMYDGSQAQLDKGLQLQLTAGDMQVGQPGRNPDAQKLNLEGTLDTLVTSDTFT